MDPRKVHLTATEKEYLKLMAQGYSRAAIAERLCISESTVKNHLNVLYRKLRVGNATAAVSLALSFELIPKDQIRNHIVEKWRTAA